MIMVANALHYWKRHLNRLAAPATAAVLVLLVLALNALTASPALHERLHHDAHERGHQCAITLFAHGQVEHAAVAVEPAPAVPGGQLVLLSPVADFVATFIVLPSDRGPPPAAARS